MTDIEKFHKDLGDIIVENSLLKDEVKRLKHALLHVLLHKKNRGQIAGMMAIGEAYVDWCNVGIKFQMSRCGLINKDTRKPITTWDEVPRKAGCENEQPSK